MPCHEPDLFRKTPMTSNVTRRRKLPARYAAIISPLVLSLLMTFIVSLISTLKSLGLHPSMPGIWMVAWACRGWSLFQPCSSCCRSCAASSAWSASRHVERRCFGTSPFQAR